MRIFEKTFDPLSGITTTIGTQDDKLVIKTEGDVSPSVDYSTALRNSDDYSRYGIKKGFWHCVHVPEVVAMKMLTEDGFNVYTEPAKSIRQFLSRNKEKYGNLFTTKGAF